MANTKTAMALGFFDGIHIGHAALLEKTNQRAREIGATPSVMTFDVHPDTLIFNKEVPLINSAEGRKKLIKRLFGIDNVIFLHFDKTVMQTDWRVFIDELVEKHNIAWIVVGHDFCFGYKGLGTAERLKDYCAEKGIGCDVIDAVRLDGEIVSSTLIREMIETGQMEKANALLGHPHMLSDTIRSGYHLGTKMGTPTINMKIPDGVIVPRFGVYAANVVLSDGTEHVSVTNVGVRPTVSDSNVVSVESFILDFHGDLYNRMAIVEFHGFLRPERKFSSVEELGEQIKRDAENARAYFEK